jgi:hypothetical protein
MKRDRQRADGENMMKYKQQHGMETQQAPVRDKIGLNAFLEANEIIWII